MMGHASHRQLVHLSEMKALRELHRAGLRHPNQNTRRRAAHAVVHYTEEIRRVRAEVAEQERRFCRTMQMHICNATH